MSDKIPIFFKQQIDAMDTGYVYGRIVKDYGTGYVVETQGMEVKAQISGRFRNQISDLPVIGDWVGMSLYNNDTDGLIQQLLERKTVFKRKSAGADMTSQVQGANFDTVFIVTSLNSDFNQRKIERFTLAAWDTGAQPVILLTKADLCEDVAAYVARAEEAAPGVAVIAVSAVEGLGIEQVRSYMIPGHTIALFGASGVGKSTLINTLAGKELMKVNRVRKGDEKGTHTTTHRELIPFDDDVLFMDTPGMRELGIWDDGQGISKAFSDIAELALKCRFGDCTHTNEPGCAVLEAVEEGFMDEKRLMSYQKLEKEARYIASKSDDRIKLEEQKKWKQISKFARKYNKDFRQGR